MDRNPVRISRIVDEDCRPGTVPMLPTKFRDNLRLADHSGMIVFVDTLAFVGTNRRESPEPCLHLGRIPRCNTSHWPPALCTSQFANCFVGQLRGCLLDHAGAA